MSAPESLTVLITVKPDHWYDLGDILTFTPDNYPESFMRRRVRGWHHMVELVEKYKEYAKACNPNHKKLITIVI